MDNQQLSQNTMDYINTLNQSSNKKSTVRRSCVVQLSQRKVRIQSKDKVNKVIVKKYRFDDPVNVVQKKESQSKQFSKLNQQKQQLYEMVHLMQQQKNNNLEKMINLTKLLKTEKELISYLKKQLNTLIQCKHQNIQTLIKLANTKRDQKRSKQEQIYKQQSMILKVQQYKTLLIETIANKKKEIVQLSNFYNHLYQDFSNYMKQLNQKIKKYQEKLKIIDDQKVNIKMFQKENQQFYFLIEILKLQASPRCRLGFIVSKQGLKMQQSFQKISWQTTKIKKLDFMEIFHYIIIQLYQNWKQILLRNNYISISYKMLFGYSYQNSSQNQQIYKKLLQDMKIKEKKNIPIKYKRIIAIGSPAYNLYERYRNLLLTQLQNYKNQLIHIQSVQISKNKDVSEYEVLTIKYKLSHNSYQTYERQFELHQIKQFTKKNIMKYVEKDIKFVGVQTTKCILIDIPIINNRDQSLVYQEIYQYIRKVS